MKKTTNAVLSLALLITLTVTAFGGEINNPPVQPPECDPTVEVCPCNPVRQNCPEGGTQSAPADADTAADASADIVVTLINLTLGLIS